MTKIHTFEHEDYKLSIEARNFPLTEAIREYILKKIAKIEKLSKHVIEIHVVMSKQKLEFSTLISLHFLQMHIRSKAVTEDLYASIDKASDKLRRLIQKYKSQLQDHHNTPSSTIDLNVNVIAPEKDELAQINSAIEEKNFEMQQTLYQPHDITKEGKVKVRMLTQEEAVMLMELSDQHFMIYKSEETQKFMVIYRRENASFGLIEIETAEKNL
ncbi:MAG: ribosome-associated translation inhibitor RaiA [Chlamydiota bacterium]